MARPTDMRSLLMVMGIALVYPAVGITFALLPVTSEGMLLAWRLAAWLLSVVAFAAHLGYEHARLRNSPSRAAWHCALAVGLGAFVLAVWVNVHGYWVGADQQSSPARLALIVFPLITGVPAFLVSLFIGGVVARRRRRPRYPLRSPSGIACTPPPTHPGPPGAMKQAVSRLLK